MHVRIINQGVLNLVVWIEDHNPFPLLLIKIPKICSTLGHQGPEAETFQTPYFKSMWAAKKEEEEVAYFILCAEAVRSSQYT